MTTKRNNPMMRVTEEIISWSHDTLGLSYSSVGNIVGASRSTVLRWAKMKSIPRTSYYERMEDLRELRHLMDEVFDSNEQEIQEWLHTSVKYLNGRTPRSYLEKGEIKPLIKMLSNIVSGAHR